MFDMLQVLYCAFSTYTRQSLSISAIDRTRFSDWPVYSAVQRNTDPVAVIDYRFVPGIGTNAC